MHIDLEQLAHLITIAEQSNIDELEVSDHQQSIRITCHPTHHHTRVHFLSAVTKTDSVSDAGTQPPPVLFSKAPHGYPTNDPHGVIDKPLATQALETASNNADLVSIESPMVGTFYRKASPDAAAFIEEQAQVAVGDTLCIIEAMKIMHEVKATQAGTIQKILANDGDTVEYGQALIELLPANV